MSAGLALLATLTPAERQELLARHRARKALERTRAAQCAEVRARRTMLRSLCDPRLRAKVEAAKASGALTESRETPGLWFIDSPGRKPRPSGWGGAPSPTLVFDVALYDVERVPRRSSESSAL